MTENEKSVLNALENAQKYIRATLPVWSKAEDLPPVMHELSVEIARLRAQQPTKQKCITTGCDCDDPLKCAHDRIRREQQQIADLQARLRAQESEPQPREKVMCCYDDAEAAQSEPQPKERK